jgi:hypothetical protein
MAARPWTCVLGFHSYVREHAPEERLRGPDGDAEAVLGS